MKRRSSLTALTLLLLVFALVEVRPAIAQGRRGTLPYTNGSYQGEIRNGEEHGRGIMSWDDGQRYEGDWRNGEMHGHGTYTWPNGNRYEGDWRNNQRTGQGTYTWPDGSRYTGGFLDDKVHGRGTRTWPNGHRYEGDWHDDKKHGRGTYTWHNGNRYEGDWRHDRRNGQGTYTWPDGSRYVGKFRDGKFHGRGTYTWPNGNRYEGDWRNDEMHGRGTMIRADGNRYQGEWHNGKHVQAQQRQRQAQATTSPANGQQQRERQAQQKRRNRLARERYRQAQQRAQKQELTPTQQQALDRYRQRQAQQQRERNRQARERHRQAQQQGLRTADRARKRDQWGAIATGKFTTTGGHFLFTRKAWGVSHGWKTRDEAEAAAEKACYQMVNEFDSNSAAICTEKVVFNNECGALFDGVAFEAGGTGPTKQHAVVVARQNCDGRNIGGGCHLLASHCSPPQPDRQRRAGQNRQVGARGDLYGSIVFSQESGGGYAWGMAWNDGSRDTARQRAVTECRNRGGSSCGEIQWFRNACGALFRGDGNGWGTGWGVTKTDAESMARAYCESHNRNCRLEVSRCVDQPTETRIGKEKRPDIDKLHTLVEEGRKRCLVESNMRQAEKENLEGNHEALDRAHRVNGRCVGRLRISICATAEFAQEAEARGWCE